MEIINKYFEGLIFTRIDEKQLATGERFAVYGAGISGMLGGGNQRYVLLFVPAHLAIKSKCRIYELPWQNLQTRCLKYGYKLHQQTWKPNRNLIDPILYVFKREKTHSTYLGPQDFPFEVLLLHDNRKKTNFQYGNRINLSATFETFSSVFNYKGPVSPMEYTSDPGGPVSQEEFDDSFELIS